MFVPLIAFPLNVTAAFAVGLAELVGPCQTSTARVTVPLTPETVIVPVPIPRMPPKPNMAKSVLPTVAKLVKLFAVEVVANANAIAAAKPLLSRCLCITKSP